MSGKTARLNRINQRKSEIDVSDVIFWHGGAPGLTVGATVLPRSRHSLGSLPVLLPAGYGPNPNRADRVYVTSDRELARAYASRFSTKFPADGRAGVLYRVEPHAPIETDGDYAHVSATFSIQCGFALVTEVAESPVVMSELDARAEALKYSTWDDGKPMYDSEGAVNPDPGMRRAGLTTADTSAIWGPWTPFNERRWEADVKAYLSRKK